MKIKRSVYYGSLGGHAFKNNLGGIIEPENCFEIFREKLIKSTQNVNLIFLFIRGPFLMKKKF